MGHRHNHLVADFWYGKIIDDPQTLKEVLIGAAKASNSTVLETTIHKFSPQGITGVVLLAESHIAIHTWPEHNYVAVDVFTCGDKSSPQKALEFLRNKFQPKRSEVRELKRGAPQE